MSVSAAVQKALYDALTAAVPYPVYDRVPTSAEFPYISFGPDDFGEDDADCIEAEEGTVQIDVWSREVGKVEAKRITGQIKRALHGLELPIEDPFAVAICLVRSVRHVNDPDGLTTHGIVQVYLIVEMADG